MNFLKNSYTLGVLIVVAELIVNNILIFTNSNLPHVSGILLALIAGSIYSIYRKEKMSFVERVKTTATYTVLAGAGVIFLLLPEVGASVTWLTVAILLGGLAIYAAFMLLMLGIGSSMYMATYEKKQAFLSTQKSVSEHDPLAPIPNAKEFKNKHPKVAIALGLIFFTLMFVAQTFIAVDPLFEGRARFIAGGLTILTAVFIVVALWRVFGKRVWVAVVGVLALVFIALGISVHISSLPPPEVAGVDKMMIGYQSVALRCVEKGADLRGKRYGLNRGVPQVESAICSQEPSWKMLPSGWKYTKIIDADVSDGTFTFGAHSRAGDYIICGEKWCVLRDAKDATTILSEVPQPLRAVILPVPSKSVHLGERAEIAQMTLTNSTTDAVDLHAFWYKKSGTASNGVIKMVSIIENSHTSGMNFMHYLGRSTNDMVYFDDPGMFKLEPGQSRTYVLEIQLNDNLPLEIGKTVGLDFVGFSYEPQVSGMPASGTVHSIVQ